MVMIKVNFIRLEMVVTTVVTIEDFIIVEHSLVIINFELYIVVTIIIILNIVIVVTIVIMVTIAIMVNIAVVVTIAIMVTIVIMVVISKLNNMVTMLNLDTKSCIQDFRIRSDIEVTKFGLVNMINSVIVSMSIMSAIIQKQLSAKEFMF